MNILDFFSTAAGGGIVGSLLSLGTSAFNVWRKGKETKMEIELMNAKVAAAEKTEAWAAFKQSQVSGGALVSIPEGASGWVASIYLLVDAFRNFTRPGLTWGTMAFVTYVYCTAPAELRMTLAGEITFGAFTAFFWWFGERFQNRPSSK